VSDLDISLEITEADCETFARASETEALHHLNAACESAEKARVARLRADDWRARGARIRAQRGSLHDSENDVREPHPNAEAAERN
jgi:hypothetical protein